MSPTAPRTPRPAAKTAKTARTANTAKPPAALVISGPPGRLQAVVSVENAVPERVAVRGLTLHREGEPSIAASVAALIPPGETAQIPVVFRLDSSTPPGEHDAEVEVGGIRRSARLLVEARPSLRVSPGRILAHPGRQTVALQVVNDGNVPIPLATRTRARTDDGGETGPDVTLSLTKPPTVAPGATVVLSARLTVPTGLDPTRRHIAHLPVGTDDFDVVVLPRTATEASS